jgi:hypothetical protein
LHLISKNPSQKQIVAGRWAPLTNGALCLSISKHNGKSGTVSTYWYSHTMHHLFIVFSCHVDDNITPEKENASRISHHHGMITQWQVWLAMIQTHGCETNEMCLTNRSNEIRVWHVVCEIYYIYGTWACKMKLQVFQKWKLY